MSNKINISFPGTEKIKNFAVPRSNEDNRLIIIFLFILTIILHILPAARTVTFSDSGDFLMGIATAGNIHGPGSPIYMILSLVFTKLFFFGSLAFRSSVQSGLFASFTACLMFLIIFKITKSRTGGIVGALAYSFSYTYWYQTVIPETYSLNTFFIALLIVILLRWEELISGVDKNKADNMLCLFAFCFGLAMSNHITILFLLPAFAFFIFDTSPRDVLAPRNLLRMAAFLALGLLPYLYEPVAAFRGPAYNYGDPSTPTRWLEHVTFHYQRGGLFKYPFTYLPSRFWRYFETLNTEFPYFAWLAGFGLVYSFFDKRKKYPLFLVILFIFALLPVMTYRQFESVLRAHFYYPSYLVVSLWIGFAVAGAQKLAGRLTAGNGKAVKLVSAGLVSALFIMCPIVAAFIHYRKIDKSHYAYAKDMAVEMLSTASPGSIIFMEDDNIVFPCMYMQMVEGINPDIRLVIPNATYVPGFFGSDLFIRTRPKYALNPGDSSLVHIVTRNVGYFSMYSAIPNEIVYNQNLSWSDFLISILPPGEELKTDGEPATDLSSVKFDENVDTDARESVLMPLLFKANVLISKNKPSEAAETYEEAINRFLRKIYVPTLYSCSTFADSSERMGKALNAEKRYKETTLFLPKTFSIDPDFLAPSLGDAYGKTGQYPEAISEYDRLIAFDPGSATYHIDLAGIFFLAGNYQNAVDEIQKALDITPDNEKAYYLLGTILEKQGKTEDACSKYEKAVDLNSASKFGTLARQRLDDLK